MSESITLTIELTFRIKGFDNYSFAKDKHLYNVKTSRRIKQCYNNGSIGYWLGNKFYSLNKLKGMVYKPKKEQTPF